MDARSLFRSQFYGQKVMAFDKPTESFPAELTHDWVEPHPLIKETYLMLRAMKDLTIEELLTIGRFLGFKDDKMLVLPALRQFLPLIFLSDKPFENMPYEIYPYEIPAVTNILLQMGILIPFTCIINGKPKTFQPKDIITLGWAKYKMI